MTPQNHSAIPGQTLKLSLWSLLLERLTRGAPAAHRSHTMSWRANNNFFLMIFLNCAMDFVEKERMLVVYRSRRSTCLGAKTFEGFDLPIILCNFLVSEYRRLECLVTCPIGRSKTSVQVLGIVPEKKTRKLFGFRLRESINLLR